MFLAFTSRPLFHCDRARETENLALLLNGEFTEILVGRKAVMADTEAIVRAVLPINGRDPKEQRFLILFVQIVSGNIELQYGFHNTAMQPISD